jgi:hypothetical protein
MEPRGCDQWQSVANRIGPEAAKQAKTVAACSDQLPENGAEDVLAKAM